MAYSYDNPEGKAVLRYEEKTDDRGRRVFRPVYLKETPPEEIRRMNERYNEWKTTPQE